MAKFQAQNEKDESQESKREDRVTLVYDRTSKHEVPRGVAAKRAKTLHLQFLLP